jgi:hypothetical protein
MKTLAAAVEKMLEAEGIETTHADDPPAIGFSVRGENGTWPCLVRIDEEAHVVIFYSLCPLRPDAEHASAVSELLTRINFGLPLGNFEIDLDDFEIRVRTSVDLEGTKPTTALLRRMLVNNAATMDLFLPSIAAVLSGANPSEVLKGVE